MLGLSGVAHAGYLFSRRYGFHASVGDSDRVYGGFLLFVYLSIRFLIVLGRTG